MPNLLRTRAHERARVPVLQLTLLLDDRRRSLTLAAVVCCACAAQRSTPASPFPPPPDRSPEARTLGDASVLSSPHVSLGMPVDDDPSDDYLLDRGAFVLSYSASRNAANWVAWRVTSDDFGDVDRQDDFRADLRLPSAFLRITSKDYEHTGFDRGHLCPSGDRTRTLEANSSTFLMTNIHPQRPQLNRGPWKSLEEYTRDLVRSGKHAYVVAGAVFGHETLGAGVAVPEASYKVIALLEPGQGLAATVETRVLAVLMPNQASVRGRNWWELVASVDDIEARSGYDFLSALDDDIERVLEQRVDEGPLPR